MGLIVDRAFYFVGGKEMINIFKLMKTGTQEVKRLAQGVGQVQKICSTVLYPEADILADKIAQRSVNKVYDEEKISREVVNVKIGSKKISIKKIKLSLGAKKEKKVRPKDRLIIKSIAILLRKWIEDPSNGKKGLESMADGAAQRFVTYYISEYLRVKHVKRNEKGVATDFFPNHNTELKKNGEVFVTGILQAITCGILAAKNPQEIDLYKNTQKKLKSVKKTLEEREKTSQKVKKTLEEREKTVQKVKKTLEEREKTVQKVKKTLKEREKALQKVNKALEEEKGGISQKETTIKNQDNTINKLNAKIGSTSTQLISAQQAKNKAEDGLQQVIREHETKLSIVTIERERLEAEQGRLKKEVDSLRAQIAVLIKDSEKPQSNTSNSRQQMGVFHRQNVETWDEHLFVLGQHAMDGKHYSGAIWYYEEVCRRHEADIVVQYNLGNAYYWKGKQATNPDTQKQHYQTALACYNHEKALSHLETASRLIGSENQETTFKWCFESNKQRVYDKLYPPGLHRPVRWVQRKVKSVLDKDWGFLANVALNEWKMTKQRPQQAKNEKNANNDIKDKKTKREDKGKQRASGSTSILRELEQANTASDKQESINTQKGENQKTADMSSKQDNLSSTEQCPKKDRNITEEASASCSKAMTEDHIPLSTARTTKQSARTQKIMDFANHFSPVVADHQESNPEENTPSPKVMQRS
jgi:predicted  nucleic acid-binding Zn-ribbon protein